MFGATGRFARRNYLGGAEIETDSSGGAQPQACQIEKRRRAACPLGAVSGEAGEVRGGVEGRYGLIGYMAYGPARGGLRTLRGQQGSIGKGVLRRAIPKVAGTDQIRMFEGACIAPGRRAAQHERSSGFGQASQLFKNQIRSFQVLDYLKQGDGIKAPFAFYECVGLASSRQRRPRNLCRAKPRYLRAKNPLL